MLYCLLIQSVLTVLVVMRTNVADTDVSLIPIFYVLVLIIFIRLICLVSICTNITDHRCSLRHLSQWLTCWF
jgi:hypothetical protein